MSYARSPRPSFVMTVGIRCNSLPPQSEPDWGFWFGRWVGHRQICAEVGHAAQRFQRQRRRGQSQLDRRVFGPCPIAGRGAEQPCELGEDLGRRNRERVWAIPTFRYSPPCASDTQSTLFVASSPWSCSSICLL